MDKEIIRTEVHPFELEEDLSLWTFIGQRRIIDLLKSVVLSHFADKEIGRKPKLPSIILCADDGMGKRTIARALVNSLGIADYRETLGKTFGMGGEGFIDFLEDATENTALFVIGGDCLSRYAQETFHKLLTRGKAKIPDRITEIRAEVEFTTKPLIIFSLETSAGGFLSELWRTFDLKLCLDNYTGLEIFLILQQRIKWLNWKIENDDVIKYIAVKAQRNPGKALEMLQNAYFFMRSRNAEVIELGDIKKARGIGYNTNEKYDDGYDEKEWEGL